ncbi:MAG: aminotransferase class I/II-fold pyridoxal phosphate-dependent enzyme [Clostridiales bacterium]|nr:aminotransferase class I/II-fold pyridoxal phosphate-dependent enzyme [Clostridiales bacterium]
MRDFVSKKAKSIKPSGIRRFFDIVSERKDVISLGVGEPDFITPWEIRDAGISSIKKGYTQYTSNSGLLSLRTEITKYLKDRFSVSYDESDVVITVGASEGIDIALRAVVDEGDEVLIPDPSYVSYKPCVELLGGVPVSIPCSDKNGFKLTPENLESVITEKTKVLIFPYPNNPTGGVMEKEYIEKIIPVILKHDLLVVSDEIYAELSYGKPHVSIASFPELCDRVVLISGFSKAFAMTGWRVGYVCAPKPIKDALLKIHQYATICAPIFSQYAALSALTSGKADGYAVVGEMREEYDKRRKFMYKTFIEMGLECFEPKGAFYIFPSVESLNMTGEEFATALLESKKVAVVPGDAFGDFGKYHVRVSYAYSMKNLIRAMDEIREFVMELKSKK